MAFNPNQPRQTGGKFGSTGAQKPTAPYKSASQVPAQAITPQLMAQALTLIRQQQAAAKAQAARVKKESPADKLYLAQLKAAQGILFRQQQAQLSATRKATAATQKRTRIAAAATKKKAGIAAAAKARNPAAAAKGTAAGHRAPARGKPGTAPSVRSSSSAPSSAVQARLRQYMTGR